MISENAINSNLGSSGGKTYRLRDTVGINSDGGPLPLFLASKALHPFIYKVFDGADLLPVDYSDKDKMARGIADLCSGVRASALALPPLLAPKPTQLDRSLVLAVIGRRWCFPS